uniref:Uncharacterized protein n=1 Tax=Anguilla anguilla TaxID=7936 RepID=A0A0E9SN63_ANGAN
MLLNTTSRSAMKEAFLASSVCRLTSQILRM